MRIRFAKLLDRIGVPFIKLQSCLHRYLGQNSDLKILAFVVALVVFDLIRMTIGHPETYTAPVHATIHEEGVAILSHTPTEVEIQLKGSAEDIKNFDPTRLSVEVKIESAPKENEAYVRLSRRNVIGADKLRVGRITPPGIFVAYDREVEMTMRLKNPDLLGKPLQGEATVDLISNEVKVKGPESKLQKLIEKGILLPTELVDVSGRTQGFIKRVKVLPPDDSGISHVIPADVEARVYITIQPLPESVYTNAPTPTGTNRAPIAARASSTNLTSTSTTEVQGDFAPTSETTHSESNSESK